MEIVTQLAVIHTVTPQACRQMYSFLDPLFFLTIEDPLATFQLDHQGPISDAKQLVIASSLRLD